MGIVTIGVDLGQRRDPTAIAVAETDRRQQDGGRYETHHIVRYLDRLPLGTTYPTVAQRIVAVVAAVTQRTGREPRLYLDATGVGTPVVDLVRDYGARVHPIPVYFTHGDRRLRQDGEVRLGKGWLVSRLQALLQAGRLHLPQSAEAACLAAELLDYEIRVTEDANDRYGAFRVGSHDDLVTAVGLAVQEDPVELGEIMIYSEDRRSPWADC